MQHNPKSHKTPNPNTQNSVMESNNSSNKAPLTHLVAMPFPGRGHVNPMMSLCKSLVSKSPDILITFIVTEEWLGLIDSDPNRPENIRLQPMPNCIPSELIRGSQIIQFYTAVSNDMEGPFEKVLDGIEPPVTALMIDVFLCWGVGVGNRRHIPVASFYPMSGMAFSVFQHFDLLIENGHYPAPADSGEESVDYIPGVSSISPKDLPVIPSQYILDLIKLCISCVSKAQYILICTIYELEPRVIDVLRMKFSCPVHTVGPVIPYLELEPYPSILSLNDSENTLDYLQWLDSQPSNSVLYVSLGSYLSVSSAIMEEFAAGLRQSGCRFLWVIRGDTSKLEEICGDQGLIVPWCDQLKVLNHSAVGGFWSHCGWNSVQEGVYAGVPFLTFPIAIDQLTNSKLIVEDWKIGYRVKKDTKNLVTKEEIASLVMKVMDLESQEGKQMRKRVKELQETCLAAIQEGGSTESSLRSMAKDFLKSGH